MRKIRGLRPSLRNALPPPSAWESAVCVSSTHKRMSALCARMRDPCPYASPRRVGSRAFMALALQNTQAESLQLPRSQGALSTKSCLH